MPTNFYMPSADEAYSRETCTWSIPADAPVETNLDDLYIVPGRGTCGSRGSIYRTSATEAAGTFHAGYARGVLREGDRIRVSLALPRYQRSSYGPPECVGIDLATWSYATVIESPWVKRNRSQPWRTFRVQFDNGHIEDIDYYVEVEA
jgi:hypothetical protein